MSTNDVMVNPWMCDDGQTYEYEAIRVYMSRCAQENGLLLSPVTRQPMRGTLTKNYAVKAIVDAWHAA